MENGLACCENCNLRKGAIFHDYRFRQQSTPQD
jgi:hypothetical protein